MRFIVFFVLHLLSVVAVLAPMVLFALPSSAALLPYTEDGLFLGLSIYWFFLPCLIGVIFGVSIDWISRKWTGKNHYEKLKWSKTRRRVVVLGLLGASLLYLHLLLQPAVQTLP